MAFNRITPEELWSRQQISPLDVNYDVWKKKRESVQIFSQMSRSCVFTVDVYKGTYDFASETFADVFGIKFQWLKNIQRYGTLIEDMIHPDDRAKMTELRIRHGEFIYSLDPAERNDYRTIYQFRMQNSGKQYVNVISRQQVMEQDRKGKAWIISGMLEISPDQIPAEKIKYSVLNLKTGSFFIPSYASAKDSVLTGRELEILELICQGFLSKEIAAKLNISLYTVNNHRKNILAKLDVDNIIEAINRAKSSGLIF